jgi:hypothetical protein
MKKIALPICFLLSLLGSLAAQNTPNFRFGFQASPTWSWLRTDDRKLEGVGSNWGLKLGALGEYYFAPNYAITSGLGFGFNQGGSIQNGYSEGFFWRDSEFFSAPNDTIALPMNTKLHHRINYIEIPIGLKMRGGSNEDARFKFYAELPVFTLGFISKAQGDIRGTNDDNLNIVDENIRDDVNGLSLAWGLGGGIEYEFATSATLVAGIAYQKQFTDLTDDDGQVFQNGKLEKENSKANIGLICLKLGLFF